MYKLILFALFTFFVQNSQATNNKRANFVPPKITQVKKPQNNKPNPKTNVATPTQIAPKKPLFGNPQATQNAAIHAASAPKPRQKIMSKTGKMTNVIRNQDIEENIPVARSRLVTTQEEEMPQYKTQKSQNPTIEEENIQRSNTPQAIEQNIIPE